MMKKRFQRLLIVALLLVAPLVLLALAYCILAFRPTGYRVDASATAEAMKKIGLRVREASDSSAALPASEKQAPETVKSILEKLDQMDRAGSQDDFQWWRWEREHPLLSENMSAPLFEFEGEAESGNPAVQQAAARYVVYCEGFDESYSYPDHVEHLPTADQIANFNKRLDFIQTLLMKAGDSPLAGADPADPDQTLAQNLIGRIWDYQPWPLLRAGFAGRGEDAGRMLRNLMTILCRERLSYFPGDWYYELISSSVAGAGFAGIDDDGLAGIDRILRAGLIGDSDRQAFKAQAARIYRDRHSGNIKGELNRATGAIFLVNLASVAGSLAPREAMDRAIQKVIDNDVERLTAAFEKGDLSAIVAGQAALKKVCSLLGFDDEQMSRLDRDLQIIKPQTDDPKLVALLIKEEIEENGFGSSDFFNRPIEEARVVLAVVRFRKAEGREPGAIGDLAPRFLEPADADGPNGRWLVFQSPRTRGPDVKAAFAAGGTTEAETAKIFHDAVYGFTSKDPYHKYPENADQLKPDLPAGTDSAQFEKWFPCFEPQTVCVRVWKDSSHKRALQALNYGRINDKAMEALRNSLAGPDRWYADVILPRAEIFEPLKRILSAPAGTGTTAERSGQ